ncbi:hypothetical protein C1646_701097 [Rhizophagus diaphanus]|nr:hypothetical protein C1646_701097 [Rhizophagus diaphanus] [Rhizophagus sp. MUCL 43196]
MSTLRYELINATVNRANTLTDTNIYNNIHKQFEFKNKQSLLIKFLQMMKKLKR